MPLARVIPILVIYFRSKEIYRLGKEHREVSSAVTATLHAALWVVVELLTSEEAQHNGRAERLSLFLQQQPCCRGERLTCRSCRPYHGENGRAIEAWAEAVFLSQRLRWALLPQGDKGGTIDTPLDDDQQDNGES